MPTLQSKIRLCKGINVDRNYVNVLNYTENQMLSLCESQDHLVASANDYSFIRNKGTISTAFSYDDALKSNYIAFQNKDYSNKWFFAWIDDVIYNGENNTEIKYTIDAWSTWYDKWSVKPCFVEREHVNDDTIGLNTIQENLDIGDVVCEALEEDDSLGEYYWVAMQTAWIIKDGSDGTGLPGDKGTQFSGISVYNKQVFGTKIIFFRVYNSEDLEDNLRAYILRTNGDGHIEDIQNLFIVPDALIQQQYLVLHSAYLDSSHETEFNFWTYPQTDEIDSFNINIDKITSFFDYTPKNNKCFCYPYNYLFVTNNAGSSNIYRYENFYGTNVKAQFKLELAMSIGCSGKLVPLNYKRMERDDDESLPLAKYPTCSWSSDSFINWLTQNAINEPIRMVFGALGMGQQYQSNVATQQKQIESTGSSTIAPEVTLGIGIAGSIAQTIGNFYSTSLLPNIQGGANTGDVNWAGGRNCFTFKCMRTKTENLKIIDDYFTRFGYKINRVKTPNISGRTYWNYVQIGATEDIGYGDVPSVYMEQINNACRRGVTIWHNHTNIGNFALDNAIAE